MPPYHDAHGKICTTIFFIHLLITAPLNAPFKLKLFMRFHYILCLFLNWIKCILINIDFRFHSGLSNDLANTIFVDVRG